MLPPAGVQHVFVPRGRLLSNGFLFDLALKAACTAAGLLDATGRPSAPTGSGTPSAPRSHRMPYLKDNGPRQDPSAMNDATA